MIMTGRTHTLTYTPNHTEIFDYECGLFLKSHLNHDRDGTHTEIAGCEAKVRGFDHDTWLLIRYERNSLLVMTDLEGRGEWKECFRVNGIHLPTGYHLGASAATGQLSDNHDVIAIRTFELEYDPSQDNAAGSDPSKIVPSAEIFAPPRDHRDDPPPPMSSLKLFLIFVCALIGIAVCVVVGFLVFQKQQETSRKRFY